MRITTLRARSCITVGSIPIGAWFDRRDPFCILPRKIAELISPPRPNCSPWLTINSALVSVEVWTWGTAKDWGLWVRIEAYVYLS